MPERFKRAKLNPHKCFLFLAHFQELREKFSRLIRAIARRGYKPPIVTLGPVDLGHFLESNL